MNNNAVLSRAPNSDLARLAAITSRLKSLPTNQLPFFCSQIAEHIWQCRATISIVEDQIKGSEAATAVHRLRTQLSALLQDRTPEGRWSAVVLTKATIEAGGISFISNNLTLVKHLLQVLKKAGDPSTTRSFAVINLVRVFAFTWEVPTLVREITTPNLPAFVSICLANARSMRCSAVELHTYLEAFATLLPKHPTIFRTNEAALRHLCCSILEAASAPTSADRHYNRSHRKAARAVLVLLHHCAQKQGASEKWTYDVERILKAADTTCDQLFRSLQEDWISTTDHQSIAGQQELFDGDCAIQGSDGAGLGAWQGVHMGSVRLTELLSLIQAFLEVGSVSTVSIKIGHIMDLTTRILSVTTRNKPQQEVGKKERDDLLHALPQVHQSALALLKTLLERFNYYFLQHVQSMLELIQPVFQDQQRVENTQAYVYGLLAQIITLCGPSFQREDLKDLNAVIKVCCQDLLDPDNRTIPGNNVANVNNNKSLLSGNNMTNARSAYGRKIPKFFNQQQNAQMLLYKAIQKLNPQHMSTSTRGLMDRTAILITDKEAVAASVLNPTRKSDGGYQASVLPVLARLFPRDTQVETILRPRMPLIGAKQRSDGAEADAGSEEGSYHEATDDDLPTADIDDEDGPESTSASPSALPMEDGQPNSNTELPMGANDALDEHVSNKRSVPKWEYEDSSMKRMRMMAEGSTPGNAQEKSDLDPIAGKVEAPSTVPVRDGLLNVTAATLSGSNQDLEQKRRIPKEMEVDDEDESDFEMPSLTMEPDTDPEDEDED